MAYNYEYPYTDTGRANSDWILERIKEITLTIRDFREWRVRHEDEYEELKDLYDDIMSGNFPQPVIDGLHDWLVNHGGIDLLGSLVKGVYFGLTDNGYFTAFIPSTWDDITFKTTGYDYIAEDDIYDYGHLALFM